MGDNDEILDRLEEFPDKLNVNVRQVEGWRTTENFWPKKGKKWGISISEDKEGCRRAAFWKEDPVFRYTENRRRPLIKESDTKNRRSR